MQSVSSYDESAKVTNTYRIQKKWVVKTIETQLTWVNQFDIVDDPNSQNLNDNSHGMHALVHHICHSHCHYHECTGSLNSVSNCLIDNQQFIWNTKWRCIRHSFSHFTMDCMAFFFLFSMNGRIYEWCGSRFTTLIFLTFVRARIQTYKNVRNHIQCNFILFSISSLC